MPTPVQDLDGVLSIAAGDDRTCAGRFDGTIVCWGRNHDGALGDGTTVDSVVPVFVRF
jgi:alpha-tubulin suppressor-like RCC1 family protein